MNAKSEELNPSNEIQRLFKRSHALVGMLHLLPLPGSPRFTRTAGMAAVLDQAMSEAELLLSSGFDGFIVENAWDIPFVKEVDLGPETPASLAVVVAALRREFPKVPIGVNCLANAVEVSISVAAAGGADFVRSNQWVNAYVANEGLIEGRAGNVARYRRAIDAENITVWADVNVKLGSHAITADRSLVQQAKDAAWFDANALIVTGNRLGDQPKLEDIVEMTNATSLPVVVGSGVRPDNLSMIFEHAHAVIIGSSIKVGGIWHGKMDPTVLSDIVSERNHIAGSGRTSK